MSDKSPQCEHSFVCIFYFHHILAQWGRAWIRRSVVRSPAQRGLEVKGSKKDTDAQTVSDVESEAASTTHLYNTNTQNWRNFLQKLEELKKIPLKLQSSVTGSSIAASQEPFHLFREATDNNGQFIKKLRAQKKKKRKRKKKPTTVLTRRSEGGKKWPGAGRTQSDVLV